MTERLVILPDSRLEEAGSALNEAVRTAADLITPATLENAMDPVMRGLFSQCVAQGGAHEGTIWLADAEGKALVIAYNTGASASALVNRFTQPLDSGMVSLVFASEQPLCEHGVYRHQSHDPALDKSLKVRTCAMIAVPFYFAQRTRGVLSCVQLKPAGIGAPDPPGFTEDSLKAVMLAATAISRLLEYQLVNTLLGHG